MAKEVMEDLKNLVDEERYEEAAALLSLVKERNAKTVSEMMALAKMLGKTGDTEKAEKLYLKAYKKRPSRLVLKDIMQMFIESGKADEAEHYYNMYIDLTPGDTETKLGAKYRIEKIRGTEAGYLIGLLQQLKEIDYTEEYGYELCKQYYKANDEEACRKECALLIENYPDTKEAEKAKKLIAVMNGEISADEIKKKSGVPEAPEKPVTVSEISTKDLPTIDITKEENEETERSIAESVQTIISEDIEEEEREEQAEEAVTEPAAEVLTESAPEPAAEPESEPVPVRIYAEVFTPKCVFGKDDFAQSKAKGLITEKKIPVESIFGQFFRNAKIRRQIYNSIELALIDKANPWILVTGEEKTGRTTFSKRLIFCLFSMGIISGKRTAVTKAAVINRLSADEVIKRTKGSNIIIENATLLTEEGLNTLRNIKGQKHEKICIILEDTDAAFATFIKNSLPFGGGLNNRIHLPKYNTEDLLGFVYDYVNEQDYSIEKAAAELVTSCLNSTRAMTQGERFMHAMQVARQSVEAADRRVAPEILKMAAEAAFQEYYSLTIIREDITP